MRLVDSIALAWFATALVVPAAEPAFEDYWRDGRAEVSGYRLRVSRYGETREGQAVLIYVTEPFSESRRVKVDDWQRDPADTVEALKLNLVRDFQTGIYDYNTMASVFVRAADFSPLKISFSSAEWCGHVYDEWLFQPGQIQGHLDSYFEGESGSHELKFPRGGIVEDTLFILLRGLRGPFLGPGETRTVPFLPGSYFARLSHETPAWTTAEITRRDGDEIVYTIRVQNGRTGQFWIDKEYPHRIRRWELSPDLSAELTGSTRLPYWKLNGNRDEIQLEELGLRPAR